MASEWKSLKPISVNPKINSPRISHKEYADGKEVFTIKFGNYRIWEFRHLRKTYRSFEFPGCGYEGKVGNPEIPVLSKILKLAPRQKIIIEDVKCVWSKQEAYGRWYPIQPPRSDLNSVQSLKVNESIYKSKADIFLSARVTFSAPRKIWGHSYLALKVVPFKYFPSEGKVCLLKEAKITLRRFNSPKKGNSTKERVVKKHAGYMIITPKCFLKTLKPFINFKKKQHPNLVVKTTEEIGNSVAKIDKVIEKAGSRGTRFFMLVGHSSILPSKGLKDQWKRNGEILCYDADSVYRNHGADKFPSYHVGRFPIGNDVELKTIIDKTLTRWKRPDVYQTRPMLIAHEQEAPWKYQGCVTNILQNALPDAKTPLKPRMILPAAVAQGGLGSRKEDFYKAIRSGVGVMLYRGHGGTDFLATRLLSYWGSRQKDWYEVEGSVPSVFYAIACWNGRMTDGNRKRINGLCENLVNSPSQGIAAAIGAIQPSPTIPNHTFAWNLMYYTYVVPQKTLGEIFQKSLLETMKYGFSNTIHSGQWMMMNDLYNIYGDPELPVTKLK